MTASYGAVDIEAVVRASTEASGVPYHVEDPAALDFLAGMFARAMQPKARKAKAPGLTGASNESQGGTKR